MVVQTAHRINMQRNLQHAVAPLPANTHSCEVPIRCELQTGQAAITAQAATHCKHHMIYH